MPRTVQSEMLPALELAKRRLREVGATADEIAGFVAGWDDFSDPDAWSPEIRADWLRQSDDSLVTELTAIRLEYSIGTHTEEEADAAKLDHDIHDVMADAEIIIGQSVRSVVEWVGDDRAKASAALALETGQGGANRSTLISALTAILEADDESDVE